MTIRHPPYKHLSRGMYESLISIKQLTQFQVLVNYARSSKEAEEVSKEVSSISPLGELC